MTNKLMVPKITKEKASLRASRLLNQRLKTGDWREGDRLPPERDLAAELGVSLNYPAFHGHQSKGTISPKEMSSAKVQTLR